MTEISRVWGGTSTGDKGPYSDDNWTDVWSGLFARTGANLGVLRGAANELAVTSSGDNAISVNTGEALVDGTWYQSDAATAITPSAPSSNPRIDRIVLRKSWSAQTVRITRIAGTEASSPSAPSLTQTDGTTWDIPLAQYQIATGAGAISSLTDQREFLHDPSATMPVADGGTGATSLTDGGVLLGSGTGAVTAMSVLGDGVIVVGDNSTDPTTITALTSSTGTLKHEVGGMEFDASAVTTGDIVAGASAGTMAIVAASGKSDGDVLTLQADGTVAYEAIPSGGITHASQWRLTTDFAGDAAPIASNLEQVDSPTGFGVLGASMTESSGIFTFPATGYWKIQFVAAWFHTAVSEYSDAGIWTTPDNSNYSKASYGVSGNAASGTASQYGNPQAEYIFDVTSTSTHKVQFRVYTADDLATVKGSTSFNYTYMTFIRLGDT